MDNKEEFFSFIREIKFSPEEIKLLNSLTSQRELIMLTDKVKLSLMNKLVEEELSQDFIRWAYYMLNALVRSFPSINTHTWQHTY